MCVLIIRTKKFCSITASFFICSCTYYLFKDVVSSTDYSKLYFNVGLSHADSIIRVEIDANNYLTKAENSDLPNML
jgi:hypothetical protein